MEVVATLESVARRASNGCGHTPQPDLLFMDIHLADGDSFRIFEAVEITAPVIFTTAYDRYALKAFKVNSIDYLLKPINAADVQRALEKLRLAHLGRAPRLRFAGPHAGHAAAGGGLSGACPRPDHSAAAGADRLLLYGQREGYGL